MKFGKRYSQMTVLMAMVHGIVIGIIAIVVVGIVFAGAEGKRPVDEIEKEIPTAGPGSEKEEGSQGEKGDGLTLYAKQHGAFTNSASAATFIAEDSSLSTAAIIQVDDQFFVWSAVGKTEPEIEAMLDEQTFKKPFSVESKSCDEQLAGNLGDVFKSDDFAKIKKSISEKDNKQDAEFIKKMDSITAFSNDLTVIRLHLLSNYVNEEGCVKISF